MNNASDDSHTTERLFVGSHATALVALAFARQPAVNGDGLLYLSLPEERQP